MSSEITARITPSESYREVAVYQPDQLDPEAIELIGNALSPNTLREYRRWVADYDRWCRERGYRPVPATSEMFANYVTDLKLRNKGLASIRMAMAAVRYAHALAGHEGMPHGGRANKALRGYARKRAEDGQRTRTRQAAPITLPAMRAMLDVCPADTWQGARDRALLVLGWAGMFRRSELASLNWTDVQERDEGLSIWLSRSKTDRDARGTEVAIPQDIHDDVDPVREMQAYRSALAARGIEGGRLFRAKTRRGSIDTRISGDQINAIVKDAVRRAGLARADSYSAHSLRAGGATAAYNNGAAVSAISRQGRWADKSPVVLSYIRAVDQWRDNPMRGMRSDAR